MRAESRVKTLRARMAKEGITTFLVTQPTNVSYLTGFEGIFDGEDAHIAVVSSESLALYTDTRYLVVAQAAAEGTDWTVHLAKDGLYAYACDALDVDESVLIGIESSVPYSRFKYVSDRMSGRVSALEHWVEEIRAVKDSEEIARICAAQELTDQAFAHILEKLSVGVSEAEIALELEFFMRRSGSQGVAFPSIVASGPNSAFPHASVTTRRVLSGDFVKLDFGAVVDGYCADMTRTVVVGVPSDTQREIYQAVLDANRAGIDAVSPGVPGRVVDAAARAVIAQRGYGEYFGHGLGHGVGMQVHELPVVGLRGSKSLQVGNVVTIEPGIYMPGLGGVRIEDLIVVEQGGARVLTRSPKDLLEIV